MNTHAEKAQQNIRQSVKSHFSRIQGFGESELQFKDNRQETIAQKKRQAMANNSPQSKKVAQLKKMIDSFAIQHQPPLMRAETDPFLSLKEPMQRQVAQFGFGTFLANMLTLGGYKRKRKRKEDKFYADYIEGKIDPDILPGIPAELKKGIVDQRGNAADADRLFQNINKFRFRYTGNALMNAKAAFSARQGDCQTLVNMYYLVAQAMGIPAEKHERIGRQLVDPRPIHGRNRRANTQGNTAWYFSEHYWVEVLDKEYDLLFMVTPPPAVTLSNDDAIYNDINYYIFEDGRCVIEPERGAKAQLDVPIQGQGRVFPNEAKTKDFIDAHRQR